MRVLRQMRWWGLVACAAVATTAAAGDATYVQLSGLPGPVTGTRYNGWFEVVQYTVVLLPGAWDATRKIVTPNCTATIRTRLDSAGGTMAELVGAAVGSVRLERVGDPGKVPYYQAVLRNAVLTQQSAASEFGVVYDTLSFRFDAIDVTTYGKSADGSRGSGTEGSFNCLRAP